jgi:cytochrome c-type protein NapB
MKKLQFLVIALTFALPGMLSPVFAEHVTSLRGTNDLEGQSNEVVLKQIQRDREPITRDYVQQPPLIPHKVEGYIINLKFNKCLTCHSWKNYKRARATKVSQTHFADRDGDVLANISSRRYFCTQCHVPQKNAVPLVENEFKPVQAVR